MVQPHNIRTYVVNLDAEPEDRWTEILIEHEDKLREYNDFIDSQIGLLFGRIASRGIKFIFWLLSWITFMFDEEYIREIKGISNYTSKFGLTYDKILALNIGYDILPHCTSSVIRDSNGKQWHLRNMDWPGDILRDLSVNIKFNRKDKTLYEGTTFLCTVGLLTGMSYNDDPFSVSLNYRKVGKGSIGIWNYLMGSDPVSFQIRRALEQPFDEAFESLVDNEMISPCYLTIASVNAGLVIDRSPSYYDINLPEGNCIVQTNIDTKVEKVDPEWAGDDELLQNAGERRDCHYDSLAKLSEFTVDELFKTLQKEPVFNKDTVYSCVMCPESGLYQALYYK